ncbi:profilin-like [Octopus bimaculoides]|uniref:profilin-like n=1 Tax=Octopus bimaculoides TaxID=37653 RepID=UPI00071E3904|nr:profilin-like [Octopus bimaculoides]|eukprot:XP_014786256.1 PREDICTED: profilin-like [Octopus bimaculoides]
MASWNDYVNNIQQCCDDCDKGCILGRDGSIWTTNQDNVLNISPEEAAKFASSLNDQQNDTLTSTGVTMCGEKYNFIRKDDRFLFCKKGGCGSLSIQWTDKSIIVAHCKEGGCTGKVNEALHKTMSHLEHCDY